MATEEKSFSSNPAHPPGFSRQGNCYTHSPLFFPTMPWAMRYKTRPPAPRVKVDAHTCVLLLFRSCVECGIGTIPSRNAGDRMPRMGIFTDPLTYQHTFTQIRKRARTHLLHGSRACTASHQRFAPLIFASSVEAGCGPTPAHRPQPVPSPDSKSYVSKTVASL